MTSQSGQGVVELLIALSSIASIVSFCFVVTLLGFTKTFIQHVAYQSLICRQTDGQSSNYCKRQARKLLKLLPFGKVKKLSWRHNKTHIQWQIVVLNRQIVLSTHQRFDVKEWL